MSWKNFLLYTTWSLILMQPCSAEWPDSDSTPTPTPWPEQFHALLSTTQESGRLLVSDMWYDWPKGRNFYQRQQQLGDHIYAVEWNNKTTFYYTLGINGTCDAIDFGVGIPRPDFLDGANYVGTQLKDGFLCNVWEKVDFIWYCEDVATKRPVRWDFSAGIITHVVTFEVGATVPDSMVQAPQYCFTAKKNNV
ncbi:hypothetical protein F3Y22_tig00110560pilonHSYRG00025 [Hibiscus syriacus]|uniref:Uncharacterized protein n=1 Tax=Hibiscus syriacus TaxID=106335 RepID=A0A6A3AAH5_HIBSY|nr:uncharacterized protein At4g14100-like [Hibiscus syriacus]KAE8700145.1 hypothetical protein F3Y22_tig00110560pilonHSYRG00025 [Hibiscus syriacus]